MALYMYVFIVIILGQDLVVNHQLLQLGKDDFIKSSLIQANTSIILVGATTKMLTTYTNILVQGKTRFSSAEIPGINIRKYTKYQIVITLYVLFSYFIYERRV